MHRLKKYNAESFFPARQNKYVAGLVNRPKIQVRKRSFKLNTISQPKFLGEIFQKRTIVAVAHYCVPEGRSLLQHMQRLQHVNDTFVALRIGETRNRQQAN